MTPTLLSPAVWGLTTAKVLLWLLVLARISGLLIIFPGLGNERLPTQAKIAFAVMLSVALAPVISLEGSGAPPDGMWAVVSILAGEFALGLLLGTLSAWVVELAAFAGNLMDMQMGFSFVQLLDPSTGNNASISSSFLSQLTVLFILLTGLHHMMLVALVDSYRIVPLGSGLPSDFRILIPVLGRLMYKGFQLALPILVIFFFIDLLLGLAGKFMPQLQLMQIGFPLKIATGMFLLGLLLREYPAWLMPILREVPRTSLQMLKGAAGG